MNYVELLDEARDILAESRIALMSTEAEGGKPRARWMTPVFLPRLPGSLYAVTSRGFSKVREIEANPLVLWTIQSRSLDRIAQLEGRASAIDDPGLKAEVLEAIGPNLQVFWRVNNVAADMVVLETWIESASIFFPLSGERRRAEASR